MLVSTEVKIVLLIACSNREFTALQLPHRKHSTRWDLTPFVIRTPLNNNFIYLFRVDSEEDSVDQQPMVRLSNFWMNRRVINLQFILKILSCCWNTSKAIVKSRLVDLKAYTKYFFFLLVVQRLNRRFRYETPRNFTHFSALSEIFFKLKIFLSIELLNLYDKNKFRRKS